MKTSAARLTVALLVLFFSLSVSAFLLSKEDFDYQQQSNSLNHNNNNAALTLRAPALHEDAVSLGYTQQLANVYSAGAMPSEEDRPWASSSSPAAQNFYMPAATQTARISSSSHVLASVHSELTALMPRIEALLGAKLFHNNDEGTVTLMAPDVPEVTQSATPVSAEAVLAPLRAELAALQSKLETVLAAKIMKDEATGTVTLTFNDKANTQSAPTTESKVAEMLEKVLKLDAAATAAKTQSAAKVQSAPSLAEDIAAKIQTYDPYELSNDLRNYLKEKRNTMNLKSELSEFIPDASAQSSGATLARGNGLNADTDAKVQNEKITDIVTSTLAATDSQPSGSSNGFMTEATPQQRTATIVVVVLAAVGLPILVAVAAAMVLSTIVMRKKREQLQEQKQDEMKLIEKVYSDCQE